MDFSTSYNTVPTNYIDIYLIDISDIIHSSMDHHIVSCFSKKLAISLCSKYIGLEKSSLNEHTTQYGKPYFKEAPYFHFNISHSGIWIGCAVSSQDIGLDIQKIIRRHHNIVSTQLFSPYEINSIFSDGSYDNAAYFHLWAAKESYAKCIGTGFHTPFSSFTVMGSKVLSQDGDSYYIQYYDGLNGYAIAVCTPSPAVIRHIKYIDVNDITT